MNPIDRIIVIVRTLVTSMKRTQLVLFVVIAAVGLGATYVVAWGSSFSNLEQYEAETQRIKENNARRKEALEQQAALDKIQAERESSKAAEKKAAPQTTSPFVLPYLFSPPAKKKTQEEEQHERRCANLNARIRFLGLQKIAVLNSLKGLGGKNPQPNAPDASGIPSDKLGSDFWDWVMRLDRKHKEVSVTLNKNRADLVKFRREGAGAHMISGALWLIQDQEKQLKAIRAEMLKAPQKRSEAQDALKRKLNKIERDIETAKGTLAALSSS